MLSLPLESERAITRWVFQSVSGWLVQHARLFRTLMLLDSDSASDTVTFGDTEGSLTHSLVFAVVLAGAVVLLGFRVGLPNISRLSMWTYFSFATASHGLLDAMTDGGLGVAFFAPFDNHRYFLPWTPIRVSPIGIGRFFTSRGSAVLQSELLWIWIPAGLLIASALLWRRRSPTADD